MGYFYQGVNTIKKLYNTGAVHAVANDEVTSILSVIVETVHGGGEPGQAVPPQKLVVIFNCVPSGVKPVTTQPVVLVNCIELQPDTVKHPDIVPNPPTVTVPTRVPPS